VRLIVVISPRLKNEIAEWTSCLNEYEVRLSNSQTDAEREINQHMAEYAAHRILTLETELYGA
jgi:hypothetical protein